MKTYKVNLQRIVQSLIEVGFSQRRLAREVGLSQPTISHLYHAVWGTEKPSYDTAETLIKFAEKHGIRRDGSKDSKRWPRGSWTPNPPKESRNKVLLEKAAA